MGGIFGRGGGLAFKYVGVRGLAEERPLPNPPLLAGEGAELGREGVELGGLGGSIRLRLVASRHNRVGGRIKLDALVHPPAIVPE